MLVRLMVAQVQECVFERLTLTTADTHFPSQLRLAQEAARVSGRVTGSTVLLPLTTAWPTRVSAGVRRVRVSAADHDAAPDEGLRALFLGVHGSGQVRTLRSAFTLLRCCCSV